MNIAIVLASISIVLSVVCFFVVIVKGKLTITINKTISYTENPVVPMNSVDLETTEKELDEFYGKQAPFTNMVKAAQELFLTQDQIDLREKLRGQ
jgi:hypothetical protein